MSVHKFHRQNLIIFLQYGIWHYIYILHLKTFYLKAADLNGPKRICWI